jgi:ribosomal protein L19
MKIIPVLKRLEDNYIRLSGKNINRKELSKGDLISLIYCDIDKEQIKVLNFIGFCKKFRSKGINTKISARILVRRVYAEQEFFLYSRILADAGVVKRKGKI